MAGILARKYWRVDFAAQIFSRQIMKSACLDSVISRFFLFFSNAIELIGKLITGNLMFCGKANLSKKNGIVFKLEMSFAWIIINLLPPTCFYSPHPIQTDCVTSKQQNLTGKILSKLVKTCLKFSHVQIGINLFDIVQIGPIYSFTLFI